MAERVRPSGIKTSVPHEIVIVAATDACNEVLKYAIAKI
jgi:hypothetical protein